MKINEIVYTETFWDDIKEVIHKYDTVSINLGDRFLDQIWFAEARIQANPHAFSKITKSGFRRCLLRKFPYKIFFRIKENKIIVIALIHKSRSNRHIKRRLK
ncbi:MAG: type II toxin-antitoxin system RelE/ParE family toxin [Ginsengibacter sp.]